MVRDRVVRVRLIQTGTLSRDALGFRVAATACGKVLGIDSSNGDIL